MKRSYLTCNCCHRSEHRTETYNYRRLIICGACVFKWKIRDAEQNK